MKKIIIMIMCVLISAAVSEAKSFNEDSAAIGGIPTGASGEYIKSVYGEPNNIRHDDEMETWYYGDSFMISFANGLSTSVISSGNNGLFTPEGIGVGMEKREVRSKYGKPNKKNRYKKREIYIYQSDNSEIYFIINGGVISEMRLFKLIN